MGAIGIMGELTLKTGGVKKQAGSEKGELSLRTNTLGGWQR